MIGIAIYSVGFFCSLNSVGVSAFLLAPGSLISNLLGGSKILLIGNVIEQEFTQAGNWHLGSGLSIVLMIFIVINIIAEAVFDKRGEEAAS